MEKRYIRRVASLRAASPGQFLPRRRHRSPRRQRYQSRSSLRGSRNSPRHQQTPRLQHCSRSSTQVSRIYFFSNSGLRTSKGSVSCSKKLKKLPGSVGSPSSSTSRGYNLVRALLGSFQLILVACGTVSPDIDASAMKVTYGGCNISLPRELKHRVRDAILIGLVVGRCGGRNILVGLGENAVREELVLLEMLQCF